MRKAAAPLTEPPEFITLAAAEALSSVKSETLRYWVWLGKLKGYRPGKDLLLRRAELLALIESRETRKIRAAAGR